MKLILALSFLVSSSVFAETRVIKNISICAVKCQSEYLGILNHDMFQSGEIYVAEFNEVNSTHTGACLADENVKSYPLAGDRLNDSYGISTNECTRILKHKYFGKSVTIEMDSLEDHTEMYVSKIYPTKK